MFIQCPQCRTHNDISEDLLNTQQEVLTCRHCHLEFTLTLTPTQQKTPGHPATEAPVTPVPQKICPELQENDFQPRLEINISEDELSQLAAQSSGQVANTTPPQHRKTAAWSLGIILLLAIFISQFSYFKRNDLSRHAALRPWLEFICSFTSCTIPLMRDRSQIKFIARHVADHPDVQDALIVTLTMVNTANFPQPYPELKLDFADIDNKPVAQRIFEPSQYLSAQINAQSDAGQGMKPDNPVTVSLALIDPGKNAVNFKFEIF